MPTGPRRPGRDRAADMTRTIAYLKQLGLGRRANVYRLKLAREFPGCPLLAGEHLGAILAEPVSREDPDLIDYASTRIIALSQAGMLPDAHDAVVLAWKSRVDLRLSQDRLIDADEGLDVLAETLADQRWVDARRGLILIRAGRYRDAYAVLEPYRFGSIGNAYVRAYINLLEGRVAMDVIPTMPHRLGLQGKWDVFGGRPLAGQLTFGDELLAEAVENPGLVEIDKHRHVGIWSALRGYFRRQAPSALATFSAYQRNRLRARLSTGGTSDTLALFRRYPYAKGSHELLLVWSQDMLARGYAGLAVRGFRDVLTASADKDLRAKAQVGEWLALAQGPRARESLQAALAKVKPGEIFPWMGRPRDATTIVAQLLASAAPPPAVAAPASLEQALVRDLPASPAWPAVQVRQLPTKALSDMWFVHGQVLRYDGERPGLLVAGSSLLVRLDEKTLRPRWTRTPQLVPNMPRDLAAPVDLVAPIRPALSEGRLICRWGPGPNGYHPASLAALDFKTGRMLWSTAGDPAWENRRPISDPAATDGRAYVLTIGGGIGAMGAPIYLTCLDAANGKSVWTRQLAHQSPDFSPREHFNARISLATYGAAITVREGEVYCLTSMGLIARYDGRDGVAEWVVDYQRLPAVNTRVIARRQAVGPIIVGDSLLVMPRDCAGIFALDRHTGKRLWDNPYAPTDTAIGLVAGTLLTMDARHVAAVDVKSGRIRWMRRLRRRLRGKAILRGKTIYLAVADGILEMSAVDGKILRHTPWSGEPMSDFVIAGGRVVGIGPASVSSRGTAPPTPGAGQAKVRLPMEKIWQLTRPSSSIAMPPPEAKLDGLAYVHSEGTLECIDLAGSGKVAWRRLVKPRFQYRWTAKTVLAVYADRVVAFDGRTGSIRWTHRPDFTIGQSYVFDRRLILADLGVSVRKWLASAIDLADGKLLWRREIARGTNRGDVMHPAIGFDSENLHFFLQPGASTTATDLVCDPRNGRLVREVAMPAIWRWSYRRFAELSASRRELVYIGRDKQLYKYVFADGKTSPLPGTRGLVTAADRIAVKIDVLGEWVRIQEGQPRRRDSFRLHFLRLDDPKYRSDHTGPVVVSGDRLYEMKGRSIVVTDRRKGFPPVEYKIPILVADGRTNPRMMAMKEEGDTLLTVANFLPTQWDQQRQGHFLTKVRVDAFDRRTGRHLRGQRLDAPYLPMTGPGSHWPAGMVKWYGRRLIVGGPHVMHAYESSPPAARGEASWDQDLARPIHTIYRRVRPVVVDASLGEWDPNTRVKLAAPRAAGDSLMLSHDWDYLYLAVSFHDDDAAAHSGAGDYGGGDYLEIGLRGNYRQFRILLAPDGSGGLRISNVNYNFVTPMNLDAIRSAVSHDAATGRMIYEVAIPIVAFRGIGGRLWEMEMSVAAWDDRGEGGPVAALQFGRALVGRDTLTDLHERLIFTDRIYQHERACLDISEQVPGLAESLQFLWLHYQALAPEAGQRRKYFGKLLRAHGKGPAAEKMLAMLDRALRTNIDVNPVEEVLSMARATGVAKAIQQRYRQMATSYLSQWVYTYGRVAHEVHWPPKVLLALEMDDGRPGPEARAHRVFWCAVKASGRPELWSSPGEKYAYNQDLQPYDQWIQLRVPLMWLDMHDRPLHAMDVFIDDKAGLNICGNFRWVGVPVKSGTQAIAPTNRSYHGSYTVTFDKPVTSHIVSRSGPAPAFFDRKKAVAVLREYVPRLNGSGDGWRFFRALLRVEAAGDPEKEIALYKWYLRANPDSPRLFTALVRLWKRFKEVDRGDPVALVERAMVEAKVKHRIAYAFRSDHVYFGQMFVKDWRLIGPFPDTEQNGETVFPPETDPFNPEGTYEGFTDDAVWKLHKGATNRVPVGDVFGRHGGMTAYAVCWVNADKEIPAILELGADDIGAVWLNRDPVIRKALWRGARPGMVKKKVTFQTGWNEILVKVTNRNGDWGFWLEIVDPTGRGMPKGIKLSTTPPKDATELSTPP